MFEIYFDMSCGTEGGQYLEMMIVRTYSTCKQAAKDINTYILYTYKHFITVNIQRAC